MWDSDHDDGIHAQLLQKQLLDEQRMESAVEEAYEVQTYQPFHGWVYDRFCDRSGNTFPALSAAAAQIKGEDKLNAIQGRDDMANMEIGVLPNSEWMWSHPWISEIGSPHCDEEGWTYGSTIARINRRLAEGTSKTKREYYHFVRRRRWLRTRVKKPTLSQQQPFLQHHDDQLDDTDAAAAAATNGSDLAAAAATTPGTATPVVLNRYYRVYRDSLFAHFRLSGPSQNLSQFVKVPFADDDVLREGWLGQRGSLSRSWKLRYFILRSDTSTLVCLRDRASLVALSEIPIDRHTSTMPEKSPNPHQFQFLVICGQRKMRLNAVDSLSRDKWLSALSELIVQKRASFLAAEDSDSVHNGGNSSVRGGNARTIRRMRSSLSTDDGIWVPPAFNKMPSSSLSDRDAAIHDKNNRRVWRPYKLVASTMQTTIHQDQLERKKYTSTFQEEFTVLVHAARDFLEDNIDILEENLKVAEHVLTCAVARVPQEELQKLRIDVDTSFVVMAAKLTQLVESPHANVLHCNMLRKALYTEAKRLNDLALSFAPPVTQATVKKIAPESPSKRRIPTDWFMGPVSTDTVPEDLELCESPDYPRGTAAATTLLSSDSANSLTSLGLSSSRHRRHSTTSSVDSNAASFRLTSTPTVLLTTTFAGKSEPVSIKAFHPLLPALCEGHMELPDGLNGYVFLVHEHDLGSLISFTLCSEAYVEAVESHFDKALDLSQELKAEEYTMATCTTTDSAKRRTESIASSSEILYLNKLRSTDVQHTEVKFGYENGGTKHEFKCVTFFASQFHALRALSGHGNVNFLCSLAQSRRWEATGGKSGAFFSITHDKRYVVKGIPVSEFNMFVHMAPQYFKFMSKIVKTQTPTVITKILGLYKLSHARKLNRQTTYIVVMENISYGFPPGQTYDIKGISRRRYHGPGGTSSSSEDRDSLSFGSVPPMIHNMPVLFDGDLMERIPLPVRKIDLSTVESAIQNDTGFLSRAGVIDYSMLIMFDEENRQIVVGLIDYLHQFDFLKKMESTSKASLTFRNPTIISPPSYRTRFINAMHRYLVGIELELELRIRKRNGASKNSKEKPHKSTTAATATNGSSHAKRNQHSNGSSGTTTSAHRSQATKHPRTTRKQTHGETATTTTISTNGNSVIVPRYPVRRSKSDRGTFGGIETVYDRHAEQAHSDGEEYSSASSDEACLRESPAVICALMPRSGDEHR